MKAKGSLRTRLLASALLAAITSLLVADVATYVFLRSVLIQRVDASLRSVDLPRRDQATDSPLPRRLSRDVYLEERDPSGRTINSVPALDGRNELRPVLAKQLSDPKGSALPDGPARFFITGSIPSGTRFRVKVGAFDDGRLLILAETLTDVDATLRRVVLTQLIVSAAAIALAGFLGAIGIRRNLRPLDDVRTTAIAIADGEHDRRVEGTAPSEVAHLGTAFNAMVDELDRALHQRDALVTQLRQFVADASHELRTPIAAVSAYAQLFDLGAADNPDDLRRSLTGITNETGRMQRLVEDLLLLADLDRDTASPRARHEDVDILQIATEAVDAAAVIGPAWPVDLVSDEVSVAQPTRLMADASEIRRVIDNLISNVRTHTPPGTPARVIIRSEPNAIGITVSDAGPGLADDELVQVFDRFWRADASRSRARGGSGLGLAIVTTIVQHHHGTITASRSDEGGLAIDIRLPRR